MSLRLCGPRRRLEIEQSQPVSALNNQQPGCGAPLRQRQTRGWRGDRVVRSGVAMAPASLRSPRRPGRSRGGLWEPARAGDGFSEKGPRSVAETLVPRTAASAQSQPRLGRRHVPAWRVGVRRPPESTRAPAVWGRTGRGPGPESPGPYGRGLRMNARTCCWTCITISDTYKSTLPAWNCHLAPSPLHAPSTVIFRHGFISSLYGGLIQPLSKHTVAVLQTTPRRSLCVSGPHQK
ncbi:hypothetical protein A6R68_16114 [Neotoma lepida]|uniref:Uncharacterized protein n=1 Tax=Neotoma lepida TaxID=56216 RepID=A0A1A6HGM0_NEOLE|nr:hypothetical protein A6R68_16114 [Neotoma lepida]